MSSGVRLLLWLWWPGCDWPRESTAAGGCSTAGAEDDETVGHRTPSGVSQLRADPAGSDAECGSSL